MKLLHSCFPPAAMTSFRTDSKILQGCCKRWAPGCVKMRWKSCVLLPAEGKQLFHPISNNLGPTFSSISVYVVLEDGCFRVMKFPWKSLAWNSTYWNQPMNLELNGGSIFSKSYCLHKPNCSIFYLSGRAVGNLCTEGHHFTRHIACPIRG